MEELAGKRVLVTGAADGIGRAAALAFAREGSSMVLVDIDADKLLRVSEEVRRLGADCLARPVDVSDEAQVRALASWGEEGTGGIDVLLNVAGVCVVADFLDTGVDDWNWLFGVNFYGPLFTIRAFLPGMLERGSGHIVNVASAGGLVQLAMIAGYCTTKSALVGMSAALAQEVRRQGVSVTAFCPGLTNTGIVERMRFRGYSREKVLEIVSRMMRWTNSAEKTGNLIVKAVRRDRPVVVTGFSTKALVLLNRVLPGVVRGVFSRGKSVNDRMYH